MTPSTPRPPVHSEQLQVEFPEDHVLLLTLNRPKALNAMSPQLANDLHAVLNWFETEPHLWVVIVTGAGRIFCAGADLKAWNDNQQNNKIDEQDRLTTDLNPGYGFGSLSRRHSIKPIIAAVVGGAYGGGIEILLNSDIVIANKGAKFALPEGKRGVVALQGGIPRLAHICGHQLASELLLLGRTIDAEEARTRFSFVNEVVPSPSQVLPRALDVAREIVACSPDAVQATKENLLLAQNLNVDEAFAASVGTRASTRVYKGSNIKEGLKAFNERRAPVWTNPAKL